MPLRSPEPLIRTQIVGAALARVRASGGDVDGLIARFDLPATAETDPDCVLPLPALHGFLEAAEEEAADPFLGLRMAVNFPRGIYGIVEFIARNSSTVAEGLRRIVAYASLMTNRVSITFEERDGVGVVEHKIPGEPLANGRHGNEFFISAIVLQARELSGAPCLPNRVWFAHPAPEDVSELVRHLGTPDIRFGVGANGVELDASILALPIRSADAALLTFLDRQAKSAIELAPAVSAFLDQVRRAIREQMERVGRGVPTLEGVAKSLGVSPRTLQRRLGEESCSFRDAVESVREELARRYLADPAMGMGEIAFRLGYSEVSAFLRAFKRWTGVTPSQFRAR
jgi:AraC-like DNA-binding protein